MNANNADAKDADAANNANTSADDANDADANHTDAANVANANTNANANKDNNLLDKVDPFPVLSCRECSRFIISGLSSELFLENFG